MPGPTAAPRAADEERAGRAAPRRPVRRTKPSEVRREDLLRAGESVFVAKGVAAASIDEIAAAAGVAKGTFYLYFASKDELVAALSERWIARIDARIRECEGRAAPGDWAARLDAYVEGGVRGYFEERAVHDVLFHGAHHHHGAHAPMGDNAIVADLARFLAEGARAGAFRFESAELTAVMCFHALHGGVDHAIAHEGGGLDQPRLIARLQGFLRRAVGA